MEEGARPNSEHLLSRMAPAYSMGLRSQIWLVSVAVIAWATLWACEPPLEFCQGLTKEVRPSIKARRRSQTGVRLCLHTADHLLPTFGGTQDF